MIISVVLTLLVLISFLISLFNRKQISKMGGMMTSMCIGMGVGLTVGVLVGILFQGDLFTSTIISMGLGMLTGLIVGLPLSTFAILDGIFAGLMGGMMGAMLGEMIPLSEGIQLVQILLAITLCTTVIIFTNLLKASSNEKINNWKWFTRPVLTFIVLLLFFIIIDKIDITSSKIQPNAQHNHGEHSESEESEKSEKVENVIDIVAPGNTYEPNQITISKLEPVTIRFSNTDTVEHDLEIRHIPIKISDSSHHADHEHNSEQHKSSTNTTIHLHATPNNTASLTFQPLEKGIYEFYCTIPGHKENGMVGSLIVH